MFGVLVYEISIILISILLAWAMKKKGYQRILIRFVITFAGVLLFEIISEPMWINTGFSTWAYIYKDVTWILTLGWTNIIIMSTFFIDNWFASLSERKKFFLYLLLIVALVVPVEAIMMANGLRGYADFLLRTMSGLVIPILRLPVEAIYAVPIFSSLVLSFYKYLNYLLNSK